MSGAKKESLATFYAALKNSNRELVNSTQFKKTNDLIESFIPSTSREKWSELQKEGKKLHTECKKEMIKLFEQNNNFKVEFAKEGMSGIEKFGKNSIACAQYVVSSNKSGDKVDIHSIKDNSYCQVIANKMKVRVSFKSGGSDKPFFTATRLDIGLLTKKDRKMLEGKVTDFFKKGWYKIKKAISKSVITMMKFLGIEPEVHINDEITF